MGTAINDVAFELWAKGFRDLEQPKRAWALFGAYMGYFALMETYLGQAIERLLAVDALRSAILQRNMGFIEKVRTFRAIGNIGRDRPDWAIFDLYGKRLQAFAEERNQVAHTLYGESRTGDGLEFYVVDAKSQLRSTLLEWSVEHACHRIDALRIMGDDLRSPASIAAYDAVAALLSSVRQDSDAIASFGEYLSRLTVTGDDKAAS